MNTFLNESIAMRGKRLLQATLLLTLMAAGGCDQSAATAPAAPPGPQPQQLPAIDLSLGSRTFTLQVAATQKQCDTGLMYVRSMPADRGMIFLLGPELVQSFWMQNTPIDLDIVYADHTNRVVAVKTMRAYDETLVYSDEPADVAIELNAGVAKTAGISVGDKLAIPTDLRKRVR